VAPISLPVTVFFDSDAMIAGSASTAGASFALLQFAELGFIHGVISKQVLEECRKNLFEKLPEAVLPFEKIVERCVTVNSPPSPRFVSVASSQAKAKDIGILASALEADARFLVTFNTKDYRPSDTGQIEVITPGELLFRIRSALATAVEE
jgi:predicted nucleic acid-binding protein